MPTPRRLPIVGPVGPASATEAAEIATRETLRESGARAVGEAALGWLEIALGELEDRLPPPRARDCSDGCAYCCHLKVIASPPEVIGVAEHLRDHLDPGSLQIVIERLRDADRRTRGLTADQRALLRLPCPLLDSGRCSVYAARPLHCAGANSYDASRCRAAFEAPEREMPLVSYRPQAQLADVIAAGVSRGSFAEGRSGAMLELIAGVLLALEDPTRAARWDQGEDAFAEARDGELEELVAQARNPP